MNLMAQFILTKKYYKMKKLLLLSAFLIFACSSDDSSGTNDSSNQTFFEKYDGVVWEADNELNDITEWGEDFIGRLQFLNEDIIFEKWYEYDIFNNQVITYCEADPLIYMNDNFPNNHSYTEFVEIGLDYFIIRYSEEDGVVNGVTLVRTGTETYTAVNNGNNLIKTFGQVTDNIGTEYGITEPFYLFRTTLTDPCE